MRLALGWAGGMASGYLDSPLMSHDSWPGPRPIFPRQKRQTTTDTETPGENYLMPLQKPLCSNQQEKRTSKTGCKHRLPQARCFRSAYSFPGLLQQRAGLKDRFRQFGTIDSNPRTTC
jgi:hypothetical protein